MEFGHFSKFDHFLLFNEHAVKNADSLGMNELEMMLLDDLWKGNLDSFSKQYNSKPELEEVLATA